MHYRELYPSLIEVSRTFVLFLFFSFFSCLLHLRVRTILVSRSVFSGSLLMFMLDLNFSQKLFEFKEHSNDCSLSLCVFALYLRVDQHHCYFNTIFTIPLVCHIIKLSRNSKEWMMLELLVKTDRFKTTSELWRVMQYLRIHLIYVSWKRV